MKKLTPGLLIALATSSLLVACGSDVVDVHTDGATASSATSAGSTGTMGPVWPKRITLETHIETQGDGVQLADGAAVAGDGDLRLYQSKVLSIRSPTPDSVCLKGKFATLGDVTTEVDACPEAFSSAWQEFAYLDAASLHTTEESTSVGIGLLLRDKDHTVMYRARVVGDSYDAQGLSTATLDYEPVP